MAFQAFLYFFLFREKSKICFFLGGGGIKQVH